MSKKKILKKRVKRLRIIRKLTLLAFILTLIYTGGKFIFAGTYNVITQSDLVGLKAPVSFLFIGSDNGGDNRNLDSNWQPLADSLILATINPENERGNVEINTISIPRDTQVPIACTNQGVNGDNSVGKINSAFAIGYEKNQSIDDGINCTVDTVEQLFNTEIDYYIQTSFDGVINLVDRIDGITVDVPYAFCEQDSNGVADAVCLDKGKQTLDGEQALAYARQRKATNPLTGVSGDDFERNIRQQEVISAVAKKIISNPSNYADAVSSTIINDMKTNMNAGTIMNFINFGVSFYNDGVNALNGKNKITLYIKNSDYARDVAIDPYSDILNTNANYTTSKSLAQMYPDNLKDDNRLYYEHTSVTPLSISYHNTKFPATNSSLTNSQPFGIEVQMETLKTEQADNGTTQEVPMEGVIEYYSSLFKSVLEK